MSQWTETYRGMVKAWECDNFGHFTVAYYFDRFADASAALIDELVRENALRSASSWRPIGFLARFLAELRAGAVLHIESGLIEAGSDTLVFAHRLINSATATVATTVEERLGLALGAAPLTPEERDGLAQFEVGWEDTKDDGDFGDDRPLGLVESGRDRITPSEIDETGHLALANYLHRSGAGCLHLLTAMGLSPDYLHSARRGFSTFEIKLRLEPPGPRSGEPVRVQSGLLHLGSSSMRMVHRLSDPRTGRRLATVRQSGVHLDLDRRRSTPIPEELRVKAGAVLLKTRG